MVSSMKTTCNYPTISEFQEMSDEILNTKKVEKKISLFNPILPKYLMEDVVNANPFSEIKIRRSSHLKTAEKERKQFDAKKVHDFPTSKVVSRDVRNRFNANFELKKYKYELDLEELKSNSLDKKHTIKKPQIKEFKPVRNYDFICNQRTVCRLQLAINEKREHLLKLDKMVVEENNKVKVQWASLRKATTAHEIRMKISGQQPSDVIRLVEKATFNKNVINQKLKISLFNKSHLNASCIKLEDEYLRLKGYKMFLLNSYKQKDKKLSLERTSLMNELKIDAILTEIQEEKKNSFSDSEDKSNKDIFTSLGKKAKNIDNQNNPNNSSQEPLPLINPDYFNKKVEIKDVKILNKRELKESLKNATVKGVNNNSNQTEFTEQGNSNLRDDFSGNDVEVERNNIIKELDSIEEPISFKDPEELVTVFCDLEAHNLNLIENVQEQEGLCDHMLQKITKIKEELGIRISIIDAHIIAEKKRINTLEESIRHVMETEDFLKSLSSLDRYKKLFCLDNLELTNVDELIEYLYDQITNLYHSIFEKDDSIRIGVLEMLHKVESLIDYLYIQLLSFKRSEILAARKKVDERNIEATRVQVREMNKEARVLKLQKTIEMAKLPPKYKLGRKVIFRSTPYKEAVKTDVIDLETIRLNEENSFFFK